MNKDYLGDAKDWWKGAVFAYLKKKRVLGPLQVVPMITDARKWAPQDLRAYRLLLGFEEGERIFTKRLPDPFSTNVRADYYKEAVRWAGRGMDLFVDPDTGILDDNERCHIRPTDCKILLESDSRPIVIVYQHGPRFAKKDNHWESDRLTAVLNACPGSYGIALSSRGLPKKKVPRGDAALLFLSLDKGRIAAVEKSLSDALGSNAEKRLFPKQRTSKKK